MLAAVFGTALIWRLSYLMRLAATPLSGSLSADSRVYWDWAAFLVHRGPVGKNPFFLGPLYPYLLWPLRAAFGGNIQLVLAFQAIGGALAATLLTDAARRLTRPSIGLAIGVIIAFYQMCVFFDGLILMESLLFLLESLFLWLIVTSSWPNRCRTMFYAIGVLIGLLAEGRSTSVVLVIPCCLLLLGVKGEPLRLVAARLAMLCLGVVTIVAPCALRNRAVSNEWIPFTYSGGYNLYVGNNSESTGAYVIASNDLIGAPIQAEEDGGTTEDGRADLAATKSLHLSPTESSRYWTAQAITYAAHHPLKTVELSVRKLSMLWSVHEYPQIENVDEYRALAGPLGLPLVGTFAFLGPMALCGAVVARRRGVGGRFVLWYAVIMTIVIVPFFVTDRYRHHLIPGVVLLAAMAADELLGWWQKRESLRPGRLVVALAIGVVVTQLPAPRVSASAYAWGTAFDLGTRWTEQGRPDLAAQAFREAINIASRAPRAAAGRSGAVERADLYFNYGSTLVRLGREDEAVTWYRRAVAEAPDHALAIQSLAEADRRFGNKSEADSLDRVLEHKAGGMAMALVNRGWQAARDMRLQEAEQLFGQAIEANPRYLTAWTALIRVQTQGNELSEARRTLERAKAAGLSGAEADVYDALMAALEGDPERARHLLAGVSEAALRSDPVLADVARIAKERSAPSTR